MQKKYLVLVLLLSRTACVTGTWDDDRIVQRSKAEKPSWAEGLQTADPTAPGQRQFVFVKRDVLDLPLGLKQAQEEAVQSSLDSLHASIFQELSKKATDMSISELGRDDLAQQLREEIDELNQDLATIQDIYFEKIRLSNDDNSPTNFQVYVLVVLPRDGLAKLGQQIVAVLRQSKQPGFRALASGLGDAPLEVITH